MRGFIQEAFPINSADHCACYLRLIKDKDGASYPEEGAN